MHLVTIQRAYAAILALHPKPTVIEVGWHPLLTPVPPRRAIWEAHCLRLTPAVLRDRIFRRQNITRLK
jgi:hypothetical protein